MLGRSSISRGVVEGTGFVKPVQAFVFPGTFLGTIMPHCLHFVKLLKLEYVTVLFSDYLCCPPF